MSTDRRPRPTVLVAAAALVAVCSFTAAAGEPAAAATITAAYESGRTDVIINGYGTQAMGTFRLRDGSTSHLALCLEADVAHSAATDAYGPVDAAVESARLDALLWWLDQQPSIDDDTAVAASALAWFYADARRSVGPPVWADGTRGFAAITPEQPESWDALATFSMSHPVGLVVPGTHLDAAERRVAELHRIATELSGAWSLDVTAGDGAAVARLTVGGKPVGGRAIDITVEPTGGAAPVVESRRTDTDGRVSVRVPPSPDGYTVSATTSAPGPHREWDGAGAVQRLATPTTRVIAASASRGPDDGHLVVRKISTDPTIGVEGARFDLVDADGDVVATARTDVDGFARFRDVDRVAHPGPYSVRETAAPPGLVASADPVEVERLGTEPGDPPVVDIVNEPATATLSVRKTLSVEAVGPVDRSGFEFVARRRTDGAEHRLTTRPDGTAGPVELPIGTYDVCEIAVPAWAARLVDTGCRSVDVALDAIGSAIEITYVNEVPAPIIDTRAADPSDDDQILDPGASEVVDRVELDDLVPGTSYRLRGELVDASSGAPTGFVGWAAFTANGPTAAVDVVIEFDDLSAGDWVVVEALYVGEVLLARHADLADVDQTVTVVAPTTTTTTTTTISPPTTTTPTTSTTISPPTTLSPPTTISTTTISTTPAPLRPPSTLPPTGSDGVATALRVGDLGFVVGVGLFAIAGLAPVRRRSGRDEAGR